MDMIHYNNLAWYHEPDDETREYFETWEDFKTDPALADNVQLTSDTDINNIIDNTCVPWVTMPDIPVPWKEIHKEAMALLETECFTVHRAVGSGGWLSACVHGMSSVHTNCPEDYGLPDSAEEELSDWTDISKFCPITKEWMQDEMLYEQFSRVRFMAVLPGGWIRPHRDTDRVAGLGATNVAINNPTGCNLVMEEYGVLPYTDGLVVKINTGHNHAVWNRSDEPRIHMIFDGGPNDIFKNKVNENYAKMFNV